MTPASKGAQAARAAGSSRIPSGATAGKKSARGSVGGAATTRPAPSRKKAIPVVKKAAPASKKAAPAAKKAATKKMSPAAGARKSPAKKAPASRTTAPVAKKSPAAAKKAAPKAAASAKKVPPAKAASKAVATKAAPSKKAPLAKKAAPAPRPHPPKPKAKPVPVRPKTGPYAKDAKFLEEVRELLRAERAIYQEQATSLRAEADSLALEREPGDVQFDEESGEGGTVTVDRERNLALSGQATLAVEEIDDALARIEDKSYGYCERCYQPIPKPRLRALPYARLCVACKSGGLSRR